MGAWEYVFLTARAKTGQLEVNFSAPHDGDDEEHPTAALTTMLGELGGKGWELVAANNSWEPDGSYRQDLYFKRPHDSTRGLRD